MMTASVVTEIVVHLVEIVAVTFGVGYVRFARYRVVGARNGEDNDQKLGTGRRGGETKEGLRGEMGGTWHVWINEEKNGAPGEEEGCPEGDTQWGTSGEGRFGRSRGEEGCCCHCAEVKSDDFGTIVH